MGDSSTRRRRAVRLTDGALHVLNRRLIEEWESLQLEGRLTRGALAALMQVSVGTAERIRKQAGNDRAVLQQAFECVGLDWDESCCEPMSSDPGPEAQPVPADSEPVAVPVREPTKDRRKVLAWAGLATAAVFAGLLLNTSTNLFGQFAQDPSDAAGVSASQRALRVAREAYHAGSYDDARRDLKIAQELAAKEDEVAVMAYVVRLEGEISAAEGNLPEAIERYEQALVLYDTFGHSNARSSLLEVLGNAEARVGNYDAAQGHLMASYEGMRKVGDWRGVAGSARSLGGLAAATGDPVKARAWFATALTAMKDNPDLQLVTDIKAREAMLLSEEGRTDEALRDLIECLTDWEGRGHQRWIATTLLQIAKVHWKRGDPRDAAAAAAKARHNFEAVGDRLGQQECTKWLGEGASLISNAE